jgi:carboxyl-terminal processing protease
MLQSLGETDVNRHPHDWLIGMLAAVCLAGLGFLAGYLARGQADRAYPLLNQAHVLLQEHYLDPLPDETLLQRGMIRGMLLELGDPFTLYVEPASHELESDQLSGEYGGIGVLLTLDQEGQVRLVPAADGPAERAGVQEGDILAAIDGAPLEPGTGLDVVSASLRGPAGTPVTLTLSREADGVTRDVRIVREVIPLPSVTGYLFPDDHSIGVLAVTSFSERTPDELSAAYNDLRARGAEKLILDLRGNSGGLLDSGIEVARYFLSSGVVVIERGREGEERIHRVDDPGEASRLPLVVIVDGATASAAEIVAAALQENARAPLIGQASYGKGSVQLIFELSDGSSLHVTSARWLTPSGNQIDGVGLRPDVPVDPAAAAPGSDPFLLAALGWLSAPRDGAP